MGTRQITEKHRQAVRRAVQKFDKKTYWRATLRLRFDSECDLIEFFERNKAQGRGYSETVREMFARLQRGNS